MKPSPEGALPMVIDPCVFAHELTQPGDRTVCSAWRDRAILPVVSRRTLNHTLGFLRALGVTRELLQLWALWLTHRDTAVVLPSTPPRRSNLEEYANACVLGGAAALVTNRPEDYRGLLSELNICVIEPQTMMELLEKGPCDDV